MVGQLDSRAMILGSCLRHVGTPCLIPYYSYHSRPSLRLIGPEQFTQGPSLHSIFWFKFEESDNLRRLKSYTKFLFSSKREGTIFLSLPQFSWYQWTDTDFKLQITLIFSYPITKLPCGFLTRWV